MKITLSHHPNPDIRPSGYWEEPVDSRKRIVVEVSGWAEASSVACRYIARNGLGGGNCPSFPVSVDNEMVGYVSYNGRCWLGNHKDHWSLQNKHTEVLIEEER
jgi:hypothetical protein